MECCRYIKKLHFLVVLLATFSASATGQGLTSCQRAALQGGGQQVANCVIPLDATAPASSGGPAAILPGRDPGLWLPVSPTGTPLLISNVTLHLGTCAKLWDLVERECTFVASPSWPVAGLQAGPGYLFYPRLVGATATAQRLNVTCPLSDWEALLATSNSSSSKNGTATTLAPCGTATVSSGQELLSALEVLQPGHARVLVTLAANISLPAQPTPQRADAAPGDDDHVPLAVVFRNVTLAGVGGGRATELDMRGRRNAFGLLAGWQLLQQQQDPFQVQTPSDTGSGPVWCGRPVLVLAELTTVNIPPGPPGSWPLGLLSPFHAHIQVDRSNGAGLQLAALRCTWVYQSGEIGYVGFWLGRTKSLQPSDLESASWLLHFRSLPHLATDADGNAVTVQRIEDYDITYNFTVTGVALITQPAPADFNLWSSAPAGLLTGAANGSLDYTYALPPPSFAVAGNATQLLGLLQEPWHGGPRVILLLRNISLLPELWPQGGAALSYNVTLAGPVSGPPVQLDTGGLPLARQVAPQAGAPAGGGNASSPVVVVLLQRLVVVGLAPPLLAADTGDVAAASQALNGSEALRGWRDSCLMRAAGQGATPGSSVSSLRWELRNCTLVLPEDSLQLLRRYNDPASCSADLEGADAAISASATAAAAACVVVRSSSLPVSLASLLGQAIAVRGQANYSITARAPYIAFTLATLGSTVTIAESVAIAAAALPSSNSTGAEAATAGAAGASACAVPSLLPELLPLAAMPPSRRSRSHTAALAGGAAAGASAAVLCLVGALVAVMVVRRRRCGAPVAAQGKASVASDAAPAGSKGASDSATAGVMILVGVQGGASAGDGTPCVPREATGSLDATASSGDAMLMGDGGFSKSFMQQGSGSGAAAGPAENMADSVRLGDRGPAAAALGGARRPAGPAMRAVAVLNLAARPVPRGLLLKGAASPPLLPSPGSHAPAGVVGPASSEKSNSMHSTLRTAMEEEIETMMRKCQAMMGGGVASGSQPKSRQLRVLGRGAHGAVYQGEWRGLPAAIKIVVMHADAAATRRERLVRETALTMTLDHPHIVPTYHFEFDTVRTEKGAHVDNRLYAHDAEGDAGATEGEDLEVAALRLKLVMQYCEGGTLRAALQTGHFEKAPLLPPSQRLPQQPQQQQPQQPQQQPQEPQRLNVGPEVPLEPALQRAAHRPGAAGGTECGSGGSGGDSGSAAKCIEAAGLRAQASDRPTALLPDGRAPSAARVPPMVDKRLKWSDITAVANLPLSLLAARDIAAGLEHLHGQGIVHGDLTENNVLLKAVQPSLPTVQPPKLATPPPSGLGGGGSAPRAQMVDPAHRGPVISPVEGERVAVVRPGAAAGEEQRGGGTARPAPSGTAPWTDGNCAAEGLGDGQGQQHATEAGRASVARASAAAAAAEGGGVRGQPAMLSSGLSQCVSAGGSQAADANNTSCDELGTVVATRGSVGQCCGPADFTTSSVLDSHSDCILEPMAMQMLSYAYKIADFGLSVQLQGGLETHLSNMAQGTPFFAAPEVVKDARLSAAADIYSFGVLMWLLFHGVSLQHLRHLLPPTAHSPIAPLLLRNTSRALPSPCKQLLAACLASEPARRPKAAELKLMLEDALRGVAGSKLSWFLLSSERKEHTIPLARP